MTVRPENPESAAGDWQATVRRAAARDTAAREAVALRVLPRARQVARNLGAGPSEDDVAQLATLEVLRCCSTFRGSGSFDRWAERICVRKAVRYLRRERGKRAHVEPVVEPDATPAAELVPAGDARRDVARYLDGLSDTLRRAIVLHHIYGYQVDEVAALTGASKNTVKVRLYRGREALRAAVAAERERGARPGVSSKGVA